MKQFFIADIHVGHENILKLDNRPFKSLDEMNNVIKSNWNRVVAKGDEVFLLGDIGWKDAKAVVDFYSQFNGTKYLIIGNHDHKLIKDNKVQRLFKEITPYKEIKQNHKTISMCHFPIMFYNKRFDDGGVMLCGHVHTTVENALLENFKAQMKEADEPCEVYNVGCMMPWMNYTPRTLDEIVK